MYQEKQVGGLVATSAGPLLVNVWDSVPGWDPTVLSSP